MRQEPLPSHNSLNTCSFHSPLSLRKEGIKKPYPNKEIEREKKPQNF